VEKRRKREGGIGGEKGKNTEKISPKTWVRGEDGA
jgi:hypothetical protein